jgi:hypothetical protein
LVWLRWPGMLQPCYQKSWLFLAEVTWHAPTLLPKALVWFGWYDLACSNLSTKSLGLVWLRWPGMLQPCYPRNTAKYSAKAPALKFRNLTWERRDNLLWNKMNDFLRGTIISRGEYWFY